jgi:predicted TPR repeat methyltransferase
MDWILELLLLAIFWSNVTVYADLGEHRSSNTDARDGFSPEALYRQTVTSWQSSPGDKWAVWKEFSNTLLAKFDNLLTHYHDQGSDEATSPPSATNQQVRIEIIGAIEEGILVIERQVFETSTTASGLDDPFRDAALASLYTAYGTVLSDLTAIECWKLASDPHTLLIGAPEKVQQYKEEIVNHPSSSTGHLSNIPGDSMIAILNKIFSPLCLDNAENAVRNAMTLDATNEDATRLLESLTGHDPTKVHQRKPKEFMAELFDSFADTFDEKLVNQLQYRVPQLIGNAVRDLPPVVAAAGASTNAFHAALDAGCGTGLAGRQIHRMVSGPLVGVDASSKMLEIASRCTQNSGCGVDTTTTTATIDVIKNKADSQPLYSSLLQMDLEDMTIANTLNNTFGNGTDQSSKSFDLIVAADVFVYFGNLERIMEVFASLSTSSEHSTSWLVFTCELATADEAPLGFRLLPTGRFAHTKDHAVGMASRVGYELTKYQEIVPRMEKGGPVKGHLFVFERNGANRSHDADKEQNDEL